ncbi:unnamed protein product [Adineta steineri]|uniref:L-Fucosyltransferase n=1 Tax=Adineta steineri TaxID=433720 RepID=A0A815LSU6_9BILA|nr:unnamed protein product [Adineta steineri]CAF1348298.1 unnamed protein product [Adineta steineri]CAF1414684.1 unnamed protein product [Adineta steineri]CAF3677831.1 unnamed protein product [Adineta steineri]CAF3702678.1 unnamed protein product [Adineta steineri]
MAQYSIVNINNFLADSDAYIQSCFTRRNAIIIMSGLIIFFIFYYIWFSHSGMVFIKSLDTKIYYSKLQKLVSYDDNNNNSKILKDKAQGPLTCLIIIRSADGALGNRMFLFASAYGMARLHQCQLYVAPWILTDLRSVFRIQINETKVQLTTDESVVVNRTDIFSRYSSCNYYPDLFRIPYNKTFQRYEMNGFYQAWGYFQKYKEEVAFLFQFNQGAIVRNVGLVEQLIKAVWNIPLKLGNYTKDTVPHSYLKSILINPQPPLMPVTWIGIHIRRGDFLSFFKIDTSIEYLTWAMNFYRRKYINSRFLIASDDKKYVQTHFGNLSDIFVTPSGFFSGEDLAALVLCEHTIVTAGTYGWWAAWLADGDVIHDLNYPVPWQNCVRDHYFPPWFLFPHNSSSKKWQARKK